ncbi:hypothetical protein HanXRQr2_Chr12g0534311 [Helianthus annuus]|uniref:Uncharacterized protein n=1 Tax=Helianthus annuus TaxID=4232 RepID=A0A9K3HFF7_HELAN|nr:hypothetical protein HanXRQr2_Chr12g0534311 [Helianthus annuus]KAJ0862134.1 hypothetical protein HanPSC8_Chr12g0514601 [Helianthus annuus]
MVVNLYEQEVSVSIKSLATDICEVQIGRLKPSRFRHGKVCGQSHPTVRF